MTTLTSNSRYRDILGPCPLPRHSRPNMSVIVMQQPQAPGSSTANLIQDQDHIEPQFDGSEEWLLPLLAKEYIEDHDVEWRHLDYSSDVGPPPTSFCLFICQYDCRIFPDRMTERYVHFSRLDLEVSAMVLINCQGKQTRIDGSAFVSNIFKVFHLTQRLSEQSRNLYHKESL